MKQSKPPSKLASFVEGLSPEEAFSAGMRMAFEVIERQRAGSPTRHMRALVREAQAPDSTKVDQVLNLDLAELESLVKEVFREDR